MKKTNNEKVNFHGQANSGEGPAPRCNLWLAKARTLSCKPKNHFEQHLRKLCKQFWRRFNNVDAWLKKRKRCFNRLKSIKVKAELPQLANGESKFPTSTHSNNSSNISAFLVGLTVVLGLSLLGVSPDLRTDTIIKVANKSSPTSGNKHFNSNVTTCFKLLVKSPDLSLLLHHEQ